jgi:hypothetical protein
VQRANAGKAPDNLFIADRLCEVARERTTQVLYLRGRDSDQAGLALDRHIGGADQREVLFEGNDEHHAPIVVLQDVGVAMRQATPHNEMTALHHPHATG